MVLEWTVLGKLTVSLQGDFLLVGRRREGPGLAVVPRRAVPGARGVRRAVQQAGRLLLLLGGHGMQATRVEEVDQGQARRNPLVMRTWLLHLNEFQRSRVLVRNRFPAGHPDREEGIILAHIHTVANMHH